MTNTLLGAYVISGAAVLYQSFVRLDDPSATTLSGFVMLFVVAFVFPAWWSVSHLRAFTKLGLPLTRELRLLAWSPVMVGMTTLATGIGLILRVAGIWR